MQKQVLKYANLVKLKFSVCHKFYYFTLFRF